NARPDHGHAQHVGLELHQQVVRRSTAIDTQLDERASSILLHGGEELGALECDGFESRARKMSARGAARETADRSARGRIPGRSAESGERRHEVHITRVGY